MSMPTKRAANLAAFVVCAGLISFALYAQHRLLIQPCPLCVFQRMAVIAVGIIFLAAALHDRAGTLYGVLIGLVSVAGSAVAGRHLWLQHLPADQVPACGPGFGYIMESFPLGEALAMIFRGSGECADVDWVFLGLSMPAWVLVWLVALGVYGVWNNLRRHSNNSSMIR